MKPMKSLWWASLLSGAMLVMTSCQGGGGGSGGGEGRQATEDAQFDLTLSSYSRAASEEAARSATRGTVTLSGHILAVNQETGEEQTYQFGLIVDEAALEIQAEIEIPLPTGAYDFYFLMSSGDDQYAAVNTDWLILEGQNAVPFLIHPIVGLTVADVGELQNMVAFDFEYDETLLADAVDPSFGISVDGGEERIYAINRSTGLNRTFVFLEPGPHTLQPRFYDGAELEGLPVEDDTDVEITEESETITIGVVDPVINNSYSFQSDAGDGTFHVVIPGVAVEEVNGTGNLEARFALVGEQNDPFSTTLQLSPVGDNYEATVTVPGFVPEDFTWAVTLNDLRESPKATYGRCAQSVEVSQEAQSLLCELHMRVSSLLGLVAPPALLGVTVSEDPESGTATAGEPIGAAAVTANGDLLGLTGDGADGSTAGYLEAYLPEGIYQLDVSRNGYLDPASPPGVGLTAGAEEQVGIVLQPEDTRPPHVSITAPTEQDLLSTNSPTLAFSTDEAGRAIVTVNGSVVVDREVPAGQTTAALEALPEGENGVTVQVTDASGNPGSDSIVFYVDTTAPGVSIVRPVNGAIVDTSTPDITFHTGEAGAAVLTVNGAVHDPVEVPEGETTWQLGPLPEGENWVTVQVTDAAGNDDSATTVFTVDTVSPRVTIYGPAGTIEVQNPVLDYDVDETNVDVTVLVDAQPVSARDGDTLSLDVGDHTLTVEATDAAQNTGSDSVPVSVVLPPSIDQLGLEASVFSRAAGLLSDHNGGGPQDRAETDFETIASGKREIGIIELDRPHRVLIPGNDHLEVLSGRQDRFLMMLTLDDIRCIYMGGDYNTILDAVEEWDFAKRFHSPVCQYGGHKAGDEITVSEEIRSRVIFGHPAETETRIRTTIDVVQD